MCGRYTITISFEELLAYYAADDAAGSPYGPRYNIAPGQLVPAIVSDGTRNRLGLLKWGLVPPWAEDPKVGGKMLNARVETVAERPAFREALRRKRCLVPADGYYEWRQTADGKRPMRIRRKDRTLFSMAAIYESWTGPDGSKLSTCAILTAPAQGHLADIHDRVPIILDRRSEAAWLDRGIQRPEQVLQLAIPLDPAELVVDRANRRVGNVANDDPGCLVPDDEQSELF
ncbi:SOS response-associated peptidase [Cohnella sp. GbtcB17]|uniref:SOS response-associated peptidase n=1 Tax=Cohnella sp. GbtcB17 TaxID=2824762 RepID=UPI001C2F489D|nr:SOS response-associated peptidase [Cohnella sp. GbtcB17]